MQNFNALALQDRAIVFDLCLMYFLSLFGLNQDTSNPLGLYQLAGVGGIGNVAPKPIKASPAIRREALQIIVLKSPYDMIMAEIGKKEAILNGLQSYSTEITNRL